VGHHRFWLRGINSPCGFEFLFEAMAGEPAGDIPWAHLVLGLPFTIRCHFVLITLMRSYAEWLWDDKQGIPADLNSFD
jgi:hypothetical protein